MSSLFRLAFGTKENEASKWAKAHRPQTLVKKSPMREYEVTVYDKKTGLPTFDKILKPAVQLVGNLAFMTNTINHFLENLMAFGATTEGCASLSVAEVVRPNGLPKIEIRGDTKNIFATVDAVNGLRVLDAQGWQALDTMCKEKKMKVTMIDLAQNLDDWFKFIVSALEKHAEHSAVKCDFGLKENSPFPVIVPVPQDDPLSGVVEDHAAWVERSIAWKTRRFWGLVQCCYKDKDFNKIIQMDEMLRRKRARSSAGRKGTKKAINDLIKRLKDAEKQLRDIHGDAAKMKKAFEDADADGSGTIELEELITLCENLKLKKTPAEVEEMFRVADTDGSGSIDWEEFPPALLALAEEKKKQWEVYFRDTPGSDHNKPEVKKHKEKKEKELRQIAELKELKASGKALNKSQLDQIEKEPAIKKELGYDPALVRLREKGCLREDRKKFCLLKFTVQEGKQKGKVLVGAKKERKLFREMYKEQTGHDAVVKEWSKVVMDGVKKANLVLVMMRATLKKTAKTKWNPLMAFDKIRAMLIDACKGDTNLRIEKNFKLLFQGKNPITGIKLEADGKDVVDKLPKNGYFQFVFDTFFNFAHPLNLINIFAEMGKKAFSAVNDAANFGYQVWDFAVKCAPPFAIIGSIQLDVCSLFIHSATQLDFRLYKIPGILLKNIYTFGTFPWVAMAFAKSVKGVMKMMNKMNPSTASKALTNKVENDDEGEESGVDPSELGEAFVLSSKKASTAAGHAATAQKEQGKLKVSEEDREIENAARSRKADKHEEDGPDGGVNYDLSDEVLAAKFAELDKDGDGELTKIELDEALKDMGKNLASDALQKLFDDADTNKGGGIDFEEFSAAMRAGMQLDQEGVDRGMPSKESMPSTGDVSGPGLFKKNNRVYPADEEEVEGEAAAEKECVINACCCCYDSLNLEKILFGCKGDCTLICFEEKFCCAANDTPLPCGMICCTAGFCCKLGLFCCSAGLKTPTMKNLCGFGHQCLCFKCIGQFPLGDKAHFE